MDILKGSFEKLIWSEWKKRVVRGIEELEICNNIKVSGRILGCVFDIR